MSRRALLTPEEREARQAAAQRRYYTRPEVKARRAEYRTQPKIKARLEAYYAEYYARPEVRARQVLQRANRYGLSVEGLTALLAAGCSAAIIGDADRCAGKLTVDHDHRCCDQPRSCGRCVRGALCNKHNTALSGYEAAVSWAGKYLARHQAKQEGGRS